MKTKNNFEKGPRIAWSTYTQTIKKFIFNALLLTGIFAPLQAQEDQYTKPTWYFGGAAGANINFYRGSTQQLNANLTAPTAFHKGSGVGLYLAPLVEYYRPDSRLGLMLQIGYDNRSGSFKQVTSPCNCPEDLSAGLSYLTVEPSLRLAPFKSGLYLYAGPRLAFNLAKSFKYELGTNPNIPDQPANPAIKGDFSKVRKSLLSVQLGAGFDIPITSQNRRTQFVVSPFASFQPYFGQSPRSIETWNLTTVRVGISLKFGHGKAIDRKVSEIVVIQTIAAVEKPDTVVILPVQEVAIVQTDIIEPEKEVVAVVTNDKKETVIVTRAYQPANRNYQKAAVKEETIVASTAVEKKEVRKDNTVITPEPEKEGGSMIPLLLIIGLISIVVVSVTLKIFQGRKTL